MLSSEPDGPLPNIVADDETGLGLLRALRAMAERLHSELSEFDVDITSEVQDFVTLTAGLGVTLERWGWRFARSIPDEGSVSWYLASSWHQSDPTDFRWAFTTVICDFQGEPYVRPVGMNSYDGDFTLPWGSISSESIVALSDYRFDPEKHEPLHLPDWRSSYQVAWSDALTGAVRAKDGRGVLPLAWLSVARTAAGEISHIDVFSDAARAADRVMVAKVHTLKNAVHLCHVWREVLVQLFLDDFDRGAAPDPRPPLRWDTSTHFHLGP